LQPPKLQPRSTSSASRSSSSSSSSSKHFVKTALTAAAGEAASGPPAAAGYAAWGGTGRRRAAALLQPADRLQERAAALMQVQGFSRDEAAALLRWSPGSLLYGDSKTTHLKVVLLQRLLLGWEPAHSSARSESVAPQLTKMLKRCPWVSDVLYINCYLRYCYHYC
jgi:hypothetical protein